MGKTTFLSAYEQGLVVDASRTGLRTAMLLGFSRSTVSCVCQAWSTTQRTYMCNQRKKTPLLHRDMYKAPPRPPFGKSDHNSIILVPAYKQKLKQEVPVTRSIRKWSDDADATLQDCFASTDWNMFRDSSDVIEEYNTSVIDPLTDEDNVVPTATVCTYPNQKPWITGNIHTELKGKRCRFQGVRLLPGNL